MSNNYIIQLNYYSIYEEFLQNLDWKNCKINQNLAISLLFLRVLKLFSLVFQIMFLKTRKTIDNNHREECKFQN